ncbi:MAG: Glycosyl transferase, WecB/TagA/CpsF family [Parcubacteria group bacterium GW2011_GWC2_44_17]|nr:MAG: Glycosyl transferase, WecB/TagA/CpsF family [Parcubacteria group bacterium GW2011_GWC2_44_17]
MNTPHILGVRVDDISLQDALQNIEMELSSSASQNFVVTPNPEICLLAEKNEEYRRHILGLAFLALPDGFGLKIAAWILGTRLKNRVTGVDFIYGLMERASQKGWRVFLFGGEGVALRCAQILMGRYRGLKVVGTLDGEITNYKLQITNKIQISNDQIVETINQARPDILLVALGAPKQEKWIAENLPRLPSVKLAIGVGGTFDFIAGRIKRAPKILRSKGLEWFWRLVIQPWRLHRIYNATLRFLFTVLLWKVRMSFKYRRNVVGLIVRDNGGCSSVVECLLPKQKIAGSIPVTRSNLKVLLVERNDEPGHWQFPQGGIDKGETPRNAIMREMKEELGTDKLKIIKYVQDFHRYIWPKVDKLRRGYRGQKQDLFILEFTGAEGDIHIDNREHSNYQWAHFDKAVETVHEVRKEQTQKALTIFYYAGNYHH